MSAPEKAPVVLGGGGGTCTALLFELRAHITQLGPGTVIHLISHDPAAPLDLAAWCHLTGHSYLGPVPASRPRQLAGATAGDARPGGSDGCGDGVWHGPGVDLMDSRSREAVLDGQRRSGSGAGW